MPSQSFFVFLVVLSGGLFVVYIEFYYLLTHPFLESSAKNRKKGSRLQVQSTILFRVLVRNEEFSILFVHTRVKFCTLSVCVICFNNQNDYAVRVCYLMISKRGSRGSLGSILDFPGIPN